MLDIFFPLSFSICTLWWEDCGWMSGAHQALLSLLPSARKWEVNKMENTQGSTKRQFNKEKAKTAHKSKIKQKNYSLFSLSRQCPTPSQELGLKNMQQFVWKTNVILTKHKHILSVPPSLPCSPPPLNIFLLIRCMKYPFGQFGSVVLVVSPPKFLSTLVLLVLGAIWRDSLDAV